MHNVKKRLVWVFYNRGERDKDNEIGLKEGRVIKNQNYSAFHIRDARDARDCTLSFAICILIYLPKFLKNKFLFAIP